MWCKHCGQDVPAVARQEQGQLGCPRCGANMTGENVFSSAHTVGLAESADFGLDLSASGRKLGVETPALDDWELEQDLRKLRRMLHPGSEFAGSYSAADGEAWREDMAHFTAARSAP